MFNALYKDEVYPLTPEEVYGIMLRYVKTLVDLYAKGKVSDTVITVPSFFTYKQRQAVRDAFALTKLKLTAMATDNSAAAAHYFREKLDTEVKQVVMYNLGASHLQVSLLKYDPDVKVINNKTKIDRYIHVVDEIWDTHVGGKYFDFNLAKEIVRRYDSSPQKKNEGSVADDYKIIERVLPTANKVKEILSANKDTVAKIVSIERGVNFETQITREEFLEINKDLFFKLASPVGTLLERNNVAIEDIEFVELIGGSIRVPHIQDMLKDVVGEKLGTHINGDDSVALGAGFIAANYSSMFKMQRKFQLNHGFNFKVKMALSTGESELPACEEGFEGLAHECHRAIDKKTTVFKPRQGLGVTKKVSLKHDSDLKVDILEQFDNEEETLLMTYKVKNTAHALNKIKEIDIEGNHKMNLRLACSEVGELKLRADVTYEYPRYYTVKKGENDTLVFDWVGDKVEPLTEDQREEYKKSDNSTDTRKKLLDVGKMENKTQTFSLETEVEHSEPKPLEMQTRIDYRKKLDNFDKMEKERIELIDKKNDLEAMIYARKEYMYEDENLGVWF